ncbi:MAG: hypothetical protein LAN63_01025 [Acidobacteriia bacterium]|nr:hypothetical protein [Terriglobia bacterium]
MVLPKVATAQPAPSSLFSDLHWRLVGPFRGGRSLAAVGVPGNPSLYYMGAVGGGVWKSTDAGTTWEPIFDSQGIASIGAIAVAPSDPNVIYVGSGEADMRSDITYGNGVYKSIDGGHTWTHTGLEDTRQIGRILIDPKNPDIAFVAALGHAYAANGERGVFRTTDGGKTWSRVLYKDDDTGTIDLALDPQDSRVIYAAMWQTRRPPWNVYPPSNGPGSGLYKSADGGSTWQHVQGNGLPSQGLGRIGIAVAPSDHNRVYLIADAKDGGLYRSDDAGKTWSRTDNESRIWTRGWYFGGITVDPGNPDIVYVANTSTYKSVDGGKSFVAFKGAPGGDDYHSVWIAPEDPARMILSSDQGSIVTLNGGQTWSSWYNQPTGQFYHVATDNRFPYWIYGAQQDSGANAVPSRSDYASLTQQDWRAIEAGGESGAIAPDPLNPNILFCGTVSRYDLITSQNQDVSPSTGRDGNFRQTWTLPLAFSPADPHKLYFSHQMLFRTTNGGKNWDQISPDLTREEPGVPANLDPITAGYGLASPRKGVIYAIAPSPLDANLVWVGTDDGLIHLTLDDGAHWTNVTPPQLSPWSKGGIIDASHFDKQTAYAAVDRHRLDDLRAYIYRTHDGGKTWQLVSRGISEGAYVNVVREDPKRQGLLYAGTELGMYVSFNDGDDWQPLQLNLPVASVRDIAIHENDLVVATHGRAFWVLDDISPLREVEPKLAAQPAHLFKPQVAVRVRPGSDQGTPFPLETPHGDNPPNGAILDYYLKSAASTPITLEILDSEGVLVRRYASDDKVAAVDEKSLQIPLYWIHPMQPLSATAGMHRFVWDLHYTSPLPASARRSRRSGVDGPWAPPGQYTVRLTVEGKAYTQPLALGMDPRVKATPADLEMQFKLAQQSAMALAEVSLAFAQASGITEQVQRLELKTKDNPTINQALVDFEHRLGQIVGPPFLGYGLPVTPLDTDQSSLRHLVATFTELRAAVESADAAPTREQETALEKDKAALESTMAQWQQLLAHDLPSLNSQLKQVGMSEIGLENNTK